MVYEIDSEIKLLEGKMKWRVVYFPYLSTRIILYKR